MCSRCTQTPLNAHSVRILILIFSLFVLMMTVPAGSAGGKRARRTTSEVETDSEIEQLIRIPASQRSQSQRDLVYSYVSTVSLGRECGQEL